MKRKRKNETGIPDSEMDSLARALLPAIQEYFESETTSKEFELWQKERMYIQTNTQKKEKNIDT